MFLLKRNYYFAIERCEVRSTDPLLCDVNCTLVQSGHHKTITGYLNNFRTTEKFGAGAEIIARSVNGGDYMTILNQTFPDLCPFLGSKKLLGLAEIAFDALKKNGKLPKCPVEKVRVFIGHNCKVWILYFVLFQGSLLSEGVLPLARIVSTLCPWSRIRNKRNFFREREWYYSAMRWLVP